MEERWKIVKEMRLCYVCLRPGHITRKCSSKKTCGIEGCNELHHRLLHKKNSAGSSNSSEKPPTGDIPLPQPAPSNEAMSAAQCKSCLPIIPVWIIGPEGNKKQIFALLDTGASFTMMEESVANEVGLVGEKDVLSFTVYGDIRKEISTKLKFSISAVNGKSRVYAVNDGRTVKTLGIPGTSLNTEELKRNHPHLKRMKMKSLQNATPQMILGFDCYNLFYPKMTLEPPDEKDGPYAFKSKLGWYVLDRGSRKSCFFADHQSADEELHATVKQYFSSESFGTKPILNSERSEEDKRALALLEKFTVKKENRWETCLLWKEDKLQLPESKSMALKRLCTMEKKMDASKDFADLVRAKFDDYIAKGYLIKKADHPDVETGDTLNRKWYLPWFFSYHPTKKPRLVYDAAAKSHGKSLNDFLLKGPDLLNSLPGVLTRFRKYQVAITGDIKEMFHRVLLRKEDWPSQTILYRGMERDKEPEEYYMTVLFFGAASSPCAAIYAKNKNAEQYREKYPAAVGAILMDFYMDDYLGGAQTEDEAIELRKQVTDIHLAGGFEVVKWNSSSEKVLQSIPGDIRAAGDKPFSAKDEIPVEKTLGLYWSPTEDKFCFRLNFHRVKKEIATGDIIPTKREMTSMIMALFDPLGFLCPIKVKAMILIQNVWRSSISWGDEIPVNIFQKWREWLKLLPSVKDIKVPRRLTSSSCPDHTEMHVFCDGSEEAFSTSVYVVTSTGGSREVSFIAGKVRVAPLRGLTIPRMELQAALLGSRLADTLRKSLEDSFKFNEIVYWSDSKSVLCQIRSSSLRYKTFQANRIAEILELTKVRQWKWVSTKQNVADDATRSDSECEVSSSCRWLTGSKFLRDERSDWPKEAETGDIPLEDMGVKVISTATGDICLPLTKRFSNWFRLLRSTAYMYVAMRKFKKIGPRYITISDLNKARVQLMKHSQIESFPEEYLALQTGGELKKSSRLIRMSPALDKNGLIILKGRIEASTVASNAVKNPPILSPKSRYTKLLIRWHHIIGKHHGQEKVVNDLRQIVWILDCRAAVRSCWAQCQLRKERGCLPQQPEMGQIPAARLGESHFPFHDTGVDYFGPILVTIGRKVYKRWGALFTCLSTRAVHLEVVDSLSSSDMIDALVRFMCVRGRPTHIWSDNGTNFVGAKREVKEALSSLQDNVREAMQVRQIEWHFSPPGAPFMGGAWESLIRIVKRILDVMLKEQTPRETSLRTFFAEIMEVMNNRPLTHASISPEDPDCITPNSLLRLKNVAVSTIPGEYCQADSYTRTWRHGQFLADEFWRRWIREYLPTLAKREKWHKKVDPLQVGDLVLVVDDQVPRSGWKKGVITATHPGKDGQVRVIDVRVAHVKAEDPKKKVTFSIYRRPASKVCPLGIRIA